VVAWLERLVGHSPGIDERAAGAVEVGDDHAKAVNVDLAMDPGDIRVDQARGCRSAAAEEQGIYSMQREASAFVRSRDHSKLPAHKQSHATNCQGRHFCLRLALGRSLPVPIVNNVILRCSMPGSLACRLRSLPGYYASVKVWVE